MNRKKIINFLKTSLSNFLSSNVLRMYIEGKWEAPYTHEMLINLGKKQTLYC